MDTDDGEFAICGNGGTPEDAAFDDLVGSIEEFMISFDMDAALAALPSSSTVPSAHDRHTVYRNFLASVEADLDTHVLATCPQFKDMVAVGQLLLERREEISEEVWEFVSDGCFDYVTFDEQWRAHSP